MDDKELQQRIDATNEQMVSAEDVAVGSPEPAEGTSGAETTNTPTDLYQMAYNARYEANKASFPKGSNQKVLMNVQAILPKLERAYKKASDDSESLRARGDKQRAEMVKQQYLEEKFLPAVEAIIMFNSADELLNSKKALELLDKYAVVGGSGAGYTIAYVRQTHANEQGKFSGTSDAYVRDEIKKVMRLANNDQIRSAYGLAKRLKDKIDRGENIASEDDYELLQRVVIRGE